MCLYKIWKRNSPKKYSDIPIFHLFTINMEAFLTLQQLQNTG